LQLPLGPGDDALVPVEYRYRDPVPGAEHVIGAASRGIADAQAKHPPNLGEAQSLLRRRDGLAGGGEVRPGCDRRLDEGASVEGAPPRRRCRVEVQRGTAAREAEQVAQALLGDRELVLDAGGQLVSLVRLDLGGGDLLPAG